MPSIAKSFSIVLLVGFSAVLAAPTVTKLDDPCVNNGNTIRGMADSITTYNVALGGWSKDAVDACKKTETKEDVSKAFALCPTLKTLSTCAAPEELVKNCYTKPVFSSVPIDKPSNKPTNGKPSLPDDSIIAGVPKTPVVVPSGDKGKDNGVKAGADVSLPGGKPCGKGDDCTGVQLPSKPDAGKPDAGKPGKDNGPGIQLPGGGKDSGKPTNGGKPDPVKIDGGASVQLPGKSDPVKSGADVQLPGGGKDSGKPGKDNGPGIQLPGGGKDSGKDNGPGVQLPGGGKDSGKDNGPGVQLPGGGKDSGKPVSGGDCPCAVKDVLVASGKGLGTSSGAKVL
ncbi:hypothetical protein VNI00_007842 [Paramarasmius palmivorus]|uniref:Uncharacterized protein n=1 Tax=Paramarasmius palmivorus TaxID=297713 RepID=A0AAW0CZD7_9AGAR